MAEDLPTSSALKQKALIYGSDGSDAYPIAVDTAGAVSVNTTPADANYVSTDNSYANATMGVGASVTGTWEDVLAYGLIVTTIKTDQDSAASGFVIEYSADGTNVLDSDAFTIAAGTETYSFDIRAQYFRFRYTNGGVQADVTISTSIKVYGSRSSTHAVGGGITDEDDAELTIASMRALDGGNDNIQVKCTSTGILGNACAFGAEANAATDNVANGAWNTAKALTLVSDNCRIVGLGVSLGTIAGLTDLDWYLSWDSAGLVPITDRVSWVLATDMGVARNGTDYIAMGVIDLVVERPSGVGSADTCYLHTYGTGGTAAGSWVLYSAE